MCNLLNKKCERRCPRVGLAAPWVSFSPSFSPGILLCDHNRAFTEGSTTFAFEVKEVGRGSSSGVFCACPHHWGAKHLSRGHLTICPNISMDRSESLVLPLWTQGDSEAHLELSSFYMGKTERDACWVSHTQCLPQKAPGYSDNWDEWVHLNWEEGRDWLSTSGFQEDLKEETTLEWHLKECTLLC